MSNQASYKKLLLDALAMKHLGIERLFSRVSKLIAVFEDREFRSDIGGDDFELAVILDQYVDDCAIGFLELRSVMQVFPDHDMWKKNSLKSLYQQAIEKSCKAESKQTIAVIEPKERPTRKQYEAVQREIFEAKTIISQAQGEIEKLREENQRLRDENARISKVVADLRSQLKERCMMNEEFSMIE